MSRDTNHYEQHGNIINVKGWDPFTGEDDVLLGQIIKGDGDNEGYYWFNPLDINFSCKMLRELAEKLSELNIN